MRPDPITLTAKSYTREVDHLKHDPRNHSDGRVQKHERRGNYNQSIFVTKFTFADIKPVGHLIRVVRTAIFANNLHRGHARNGTCPRHIPVNKLNVGETPPALSLVRYFLELILQGQLHRSQARRFIVQLAQGR